MRERAGRINLEANDIFTHSTYICNLQMECSVYSRDIARDFSIKELHDVDVRDEA